MKPHDKAGDPWLSVAHAGYRRPRALRDPEPAREHLPTIERVPPADGDRRGLAFLSVCTYNHLHYARVLFASLREFHPDAACFLVVADAEHHPPPAIPGVTVLAPRDFGATGFEFLALKYSATDLCCALKALGLKHLSTAVPLRHVIYVDADICVYARFDALLAALETAPAVVVPHVRAPFPHPERFWERPSLGDLAYAGVMNAGLFGIELSARTRQFIDTWAHMVVMPGAFLPALGGQWEQNAFNWITSFVPDVRVLHDASYNVAYWNLHDRSLRWRGFDGGRGWTVDGAPLTCFHFSGYKPSDPLTLSSHDRRYALFLMPSLAKLTDDYAERLRQHGSGEFSAAGYGFDAFPSGIAIDARMRHIFMNDEPQLRLDVDPWTPAGEAAYCETLLTPLPHRGALPILIATIYDERRDLQRDFPDADVDPGGLLDWFREFGLHEHHYLALYDAYRQVIPHPASVRHLSAPSGRRSARRLSPGSPPDYSGEIPFISPMQFVRHIYEGREDVRREFPHVLSDDADRFVRWLETHGRREALADAHCIRAFERCARDRSLTRLFSFVNRTDGLMTPWPLAFVGEGRIPFARALMRTLEHGLEYTLDDVITYLWTMDVAPWRGLPFVLELSANLRRRPSSRLPEGQAELLAPAIANDRRLAHALTDWQTEHDSPAERAEQTRIRAWERQREQPASAVQYLQGRHGWHAHTSPAAPGAAPVANVFGYFRSPIGLGEMSRGLEAALQLNSIRVARSVIGNVTMDHDLAPKDFVRTFDPAAAWNLVVSYPHLDGMMQHHYPGWMFDGRRNIAYLAWEQRDGSHHWRDVYAPFDDVWALSSFAAESLSRCLDRRVHALPCVLDASTLPPAGAKASFGLRQDRFTVLYMFDANSSIERKNPEAALRAFADAFQANEAVELCLKISHAGRAEHRTRVDRLLREAARLGSRVRVITGHESRARTLQLISSVDCYMSLHRAEGFGYTCAEAMAYGVPVVASRYSGNLDFMDDENSFLVDCREIEVARAEGPFSRGTVWGDPIPDAAVAALRQVYDQRTAARAVGARGAQTVRDRLSPQAIARRCATLLELDAGTAVGKSAS